MSAPAPATALERIEQAHATVQPRLGGGPAWQARRSAALTQLLARGLPDRRDENWRYLDFNDLQQRDFSAPRRFSVVSVPSRRPAVQLTPVQTVS